MSLLVDSRLEQMENIARSAIAKNRPMASHDLRAYLEIFDPETVLALVLTVKHAINMERQANGGKAYEPPADPVN